MAIRHDDGSGWVGWEDGIVKRNDMDGNDGVWAAETFAFSIGEGWVEEGGNTTSQNL